MPDPTKAPLVKKVFRGIRAVHPAPEKQAKPFQHWIHASQLTTGPVFPAINRLDISFSKVSVVKGGGKNVTCPL